MRSAPAEEAPLPRQGVWWAALLAASVALRVALILASRRHLQSDEALVGVMALDIMDGAPIPAFPYGNSYAGGHVLEALAMIPLFRLFGPSDALVVLVPALSACVYVAVVHAFLREHLGPRFALLASALFSLSATFLEFNFYVNGGMETSALAWLGLLFFFRHWLDPLGRPAAAAAAGFLLGAAYWGFDYALFYLMAALGLWWTRARLDPRRWGRAALAFALAFPLGAAPLVAHNVANDFSNFRNLFARTASPIGPVDPFPIAFLRKAAGLWTHDLPAFFTNDIYDFIPAIPAAAWIAYGCFVAGLAAFVWDQRRPVAELARAFLSRKPLEPRGELVPAGLVLMILLYMALYCASSSGGQAPRYLLPLFPFIPIALAWGLRRLWRAWRPAAVAALAIYGATQALFIRQMAGDTTTTEWRITTHGEDLAKLAEFLESRGIRNVVAPYEIKMKLMFATRKRVLVAAEPFGYDRDPGHAVNFEVIRRVNRLGEPMALVLDREMRMAGIVLNFKSAAPFDPEKALADLRARGIGYETSHVGRDYVVFHGFTKRFRLPEPPGG